MQKIIEERLFDLFNVRESIPEGNREEGQVTTFIKLATLNELHSLSQLIADDIKKEWKVIASGEVEVYKYHTVIDDLDLGNENDNDLLETINKYSGKTIEIAVRIIDETKE